MKNFSTDKPCTACGLSGENMVCLHHIKTRGSGGSDQPHNLMPLCQKHHNMIHAKGLIWMSENFPRVKRFLFDRGWRVLQSGMDQKFIHLDER